MAHEELLEGAQLLELGLFEDAAKAFARAVALHPDDPAVLLAFARSLLTLERFEQAEPILERLLELRPAHPEVTSHLARLRAQRGDLPAIEVLRTLSQRTEAEFPEHYNLGWVQLKRGVLDEAEAAFQRALKKEPRSSHALTCLGEVELRRKRFPAAIEHLTRATQLAPKNAFAMLMLGRAHLASGNGKAAARAFSEAIARDTTTWAAYEDLIRLFLGMGNVNRAVYIASAYRARRSNHGQAAYLLGLAQLTAMNFELARKALEEALVESPSAWEPRQALARVEKLTKNPQKAISLLEEALSLAPGELAPSIDLALLLLEENRKAEVPGAVAKALAKHPEDPALNLNLALALSDSDPASARPAAEKALRGNPKIREQAERLLRAMA